MQKIKCFWGLGLLLLASCQKELHFPPTDHVVVPQEKLVAAIVVQDVAQNDYDSVRYRYFADRILEVHYGVTGDSVRRTYYYDANERLVKLEDELAIFYTNNNKARRISFLYNSNGELVQTITDFNGVSGIKAHINYQQQGNNKMILVYDSSYSGPGYDLDWADRVIYNIISPDNNLLYDSSIYYNNRNSGTSSRVVSYSYGADGNLSATGKYTYQGSGLTQWGQTIFSSDKSAPVLQGLRKKLYRNLANWYEVSSIAQDDNYRPFSIPGGIYRKVAYAGFSDNGGPTPQAVSQVFEYENYYDKDLLIKSDRTASVSGQGNIHNVKQIRYYYY
jgi:hypothetical protein